MAVGSDEAGRIKQSDVDSAGNDGRCDGTRTGKPLELNVEPGFFEKRQIDAAKRLRTNLDRNDTDAHGIGTFLCS